MPGREYSDRRLYKLLLRQARPCWALLCAQFLVSSLATPIALLVPVPLKIAIDSVIGSQPLPGWLDAVLPAAVAQSDTALTFVAGMLFVVIALLDQIQRLGTSVLGTYIGERLTLALRARLFRHVQRLSMSFHDARGTADSVYRIQYDATCIQQVLINGIMPLLTSAFTIVGMVYVTARLDWVLALVAVTVTPLVILITLQGRRLLRDGWRHAKSLDSTALSVVQEVLTGLRIVKAFGQEEREHGRYVSQAGKSMRSRVRITVIDGLFGVCVGLTTAIGTALVLYVGINHVQQGVITLGDLVLVMAYLAQLYVPIQYISKSVTGLQSALASAERVFRLLEEEPDVPERPYARHLSRATGSIEFRRVFFSYNAENPVLGDVSFELAPGNKLGISGATGAGKTTLVNLLMRFYDPTDGQILLDGEDLRDYRLADLRNQFGMVLQEPVLFSTSIGENIAYARPGASQEEIIQAAKAAHAHRFITELPDGYETLVGERGMRLSGGERQRVSIARAFLKDAPILILDEPTSSVDVDTEAAIMEAIEQLMQGRTTLMIAHRLSTLAQCDVRLEVHNGRVIRPTRANSAPQALRQASLPDGDEALMGTAFGTGRVDGTHRSEHGLHRRHQPRPVFTALETFSEIALPVQAFPADRRQWLAGLTAVARAEPSASQPTSQAPIVMAGSGEAVLQLPDEAPQPAVIRIAGNSAARYFGVRTHLGHSLVNTTYPYDGVRLLDWTSGESTRLEVHAQGPWLIEVLTLPDTPSFDASFRGRGDAVVRFTGSGAAAEITGNRAEQYFGVRSISEQGAVRLVNTTRTYSTTCPISAGPQLFEIEAVGSWTITVR